MIPLATIDVKHSNSIFSYITHHKTRIQATSFAPLDRNRLTHPDGTHFGYRYVLIYVVLPDGTGNEQRRPNSGRGIVFVVAGLVIILGFFVLGVLTSPGPGAVEATASTSTTTTSLAVVEPPIDLENFTADQLARGDPLDWESSLRVVEGYPLALVEHDGLYVFATEAPNFSGFDTGGLRAWRSNDGIAWEPRGQVIAERHTIASISSTEQGLVALGSQPGHSGFTVWRSEDGSNWEPEEVALENANEMTTFYPTAAGGVGSLLVVAGDVQVDWLAPLREKLGETVDYGWGVEVVGDEIQFTLYGPVGWRLAAVSGDELGLSEEERDVIKDFYSGIGDDTADLWIKDGDSAWQRTVIPDAHWIDRIGTTPAGEVIAHGWGSLGPRSWTSTDGLNWEAAPPPAHPYLNERWGDDNLVAPNPNGGHSVLVSSDGLEWEDIGPADSFPAPFQWWTNAIAAGPGGIATTITGWDESTQQPFERTTDPDGVRLTNEDGTLIIGSQSGKYTLEMGDQTYHWLAAQLTGVEVDLDTGSLRFLHPETGDPLTSFPLEDIYEAQAELFTLDLVNSSEYHVFGFTSDGVEWTIQSLDDFGSGNTFNLLAVTGTHVVATAVDRAAFYDPSSAPGFAVWTAAIP
jgi:hypothetical protein